MIWPGAANNQQRMGWLGLCLPREPSFRIALRIMILSSAGLHDLRSLTINKMLQITPSLQSLALHLENLSGLGLKLVNKMSKVCPGRLARVWLSSWSDCPVWPGYDNSISGFWSMHRKIGSKSSKIIVYLWTALRMHNHGRHESLLPAFGMRIKTGLAGSNG